MAGAANRSHRRLGSVCALLTSVVLAACPSADQVVGEWRIQASRCAEPNDVAVTEERAWTLAEARLRDAVPGPADDEFARDRAVLACGLRDASHAAGWSHHAFGADTWLLTFRDGDGLAALAAIDARAGRVATLTAGVWE